LDTPAGSDPDPGEARQLAEVPEVPGYRIVRPLGAGGMGSVYVLEKLATHQQYAVKFLREDHLDNPKSQARFSREIQSLRAIRHPHIVSVFDWSVPDGHSMDRPYVVMELLEGEGLDRLLRRRQTLPAPLAVSIMLQVLDGLSAVHELGIIHRDLGPSNVFVLPQPKGKYLAKVLDFGLARALDESGEAGSNVTQQGTLMGKPGYVAPEMFKQQPFDARSDIYACGIILFRMLAGQLPYREKQARTLWAERYAERHLAIERPSIRNYVSTVPEPLAMCIAKAVRTNPDERYQTAEDMQVDLLQLENSLSDQDVVAGILADAGGTEPPQTTGTRMAVEAAGTSPAAGPPRRRWPIWIAGAGGAAVVLAVVLALALGGGATTGAAPDGAVPETAQVVAAAPAADSPTIPAEAGTAGAKVPVAVPTDAADGTVGPVTDHGAAPDAGAPASPEALASEDADIEPSPADAGADAAAATVHFAFEEIPDGSRVTVGGRTVDPVAGIDLPRSDDSVVVFVSAPRRGVQSYRTSLAADRDRVVRPVFRRSGGSRDAGPTVIHGQQGTTFVIDLGGQP
jgi:tRNA A-37 threonylcarbamoyl transferase component Bud32